MIPTIGYASKSKTSKLKPYEFSRKDVGPHEILIDIQYCGVCHSDVHQVKNEWQNTLYPCMPGHEIIGVVEKVGKKVSRWKTGELVGVGCMIDSCHKCESCKEGLEQFCVRGATATYNGNLRHPEESENTYGGYSKKIVVKEDFVLRIPRGMEITSAAPILCAGITTYSPMRHWKVKKGTRVGVVGIGGLGNMAIKIAHALGAEVTAITSSREKMEHTKKIGAKHVLLSKDKKAMAKAAGTLDFIISTIPQPHDINPFIELLARDGVISVVGCLAPLTEPLDMSKMIMERRTLATSVIGGVAETQEVLDFCAKHKIAPDIELIDIHEINEVYEQLHNGDVDHRFVIDMASIQGDHESKGVLEKLGFTPAEKKKAH